MLNIIFISYYLIGDYSRDPALAGLHCEQSEHGGESVVVMKRLPRPNPRLEQIFVTMVWFVTSDTGGLSSWENTKNSPLKLLKLVFFQPHYLCQWLTDSPRRCACSRRCRRRTSHWTVGRQQQQKWTRKYFLKNCKDFPKSTTWNRR